MRDIKYKIKYCYIDNSYWDDGNRTKCEAVVCNDNESLSIKLDMLIKQYGINNVFLEIIDTVSLHGQQFLLWYEEYCRTKRIPNLDFNDKK